MANLSREILKKSIGLVRAGGFIQTKNVWKEAMSPLLRPQIRLLSTTQIRSCASNDVAALEDEEGSELQEEEGELKEFEHQYVTNEMGTGRLTAKKVDVETSIRYMDSPAYLRTYGEEPVWKLYRRNFRGKMPSQKTRNSCHRGVWLQSNPCPICRDEYLVIHRTNTKLLEQFQDAITGDIFAAHKTNVCQRQHKKLRTAVREAYDHGNMLMPVPFRRFNYATYYKNLPKKVRKEEKRIQKMEHSHAPIPAFAFDAETSASKVKERRQNESETVDASVSSKDLKSLDASMSNQNVESVNGSDNNNDASTKA